LLLRFKNVNIFIWVQYRLLWTELQLCFHRVQF